MYHGSVERKCWKLLCYRKAQPFSKLFPWNRFPGCFPKHYQSHCRNIQAHWRLCFPISPRDLMKFRKENLCRWDESTIKKRNCPKFQSDDVFDDRMYKITVTKNTGIVSRFFLVLQYWKRHSTNAGSLLRQNVSRAVEMDTISFFRVLTESSFYEWLTDFAVTQQKKMTISTTNRKIVINNQSLKNFFLIRSCCEKSVMHWTKEHLGFLKRNGMKPRCFFSTGRRFVHLTKNFLFSKRWR